MVANNLIGVLIHQRSRPPAQVHLHEVLKPDFSQEADALAVPPEVIGQPSSCCQLPDLSLCDACPSKCLLDFEESPLLLKATRSSLKSFFHPIKK